MISMTSLMPCCRYYISVRAHGEFSSPFVSICRFLISPEVSITPPFVAFRSRLRMRSFLDSWSYLRSYSSIQYRSYFWMVAVDNWAFLQASGASVLLRFAEESVPSAETPYANGTIVVEQEVGCFVVKNVYLSAYSMYIFGVIVQSGPPPIPLAADGTPLVIQYTSALYTQDDYPVTCKQVRARAAAAGRFMTRFNRRGDWSHCTEAPPTRTCSLLSRSVIMVAVDRNHHLLHCSSSHMFSRCRLK